MTELEILKANGDLLDVDGPQALVAVDTSAICQEPTSSAVS